MQKLFNKANEFLKQSTWEDFLLIKMCLWAMGIIWGMAIPKKSRRPVAFIVGLVFIATYIPLMLKFFGIMDDEILNHKGENTL